MHVRIWRAEGALMTVTTFTVIAGSADQRSMQAKTQTQPSSRVQGHGGVGTPPQVGAWGDDGAVMGPGFAAVAAPLRR